jgi:hypothetical protein
MTETRQRLPDRRASETFAFDAAGRCIGVFDSMIEAVRAIPIATSELAP